MTAPFQFSDRLLRSAAVRRPWSPADLRAEMDAPASAASQLVTRRRERPNHPAGFGPYGEQARQRRVYDRTKSRRRKRMMGGDGHIPNTIRHWFTEGERAVLSVIAGEVKRRGKCDLEVEKIAGIAGVSIRLTQYAIATASWRSGKVRELQVSERPPLLILVEYRPRKGRKSLPNVIKIVSREWINWLSYRPSEAPAQEAAAEGEWTVFDAYVGRLPGLFMGIGCRKKHTPEKPLSRDVEEQNRRADLADGWQRLRYGLPLKEAYERERAGPLPPPGQ